MEKLIEANKISFRYGNTPIFSNIDFTVYEGDFIAVTGSNGAGKSTLLKTLLGELSPNTGVIRLFGQEVRHFKQWAKIGYVPQNGFSSNENFPATAQEIVQANLYSQIGLLKFPKKEHREKTRQALELVGMEAYAKRLIGELSGGQQQRVLLARVLVNDPKIMLLDEPTTGIDSNAIQSLYQLLERLNRDTGLTILMVTHDIGRASDFVSRTFCLEEGSLVELNKAQIEEELLHKHKHPTEDKTLTACKGGHHHGNTGI